MTEWALRDRSLARNPGINSTGCPSPTLVTWYNLRKINNRHKAAQALKFSTKNLKIEGLAIFLIVFVWAFTTTVIFILLEKPPAKEPRIGIPLALRNWQNEATSAICAYSLYRSPIRLQIFSVEYHLPPQREGAF